MPGKVATAREFCPLNGLANDGVSHQPSSEVNHCPLSEFLNSIRNLMISRVYEQSP